MVGSGPVFSETNAFPFLWIDESGMRFSAYPRLFNPCLLQDGAFFSSLKSLQCFDSRILGDIGLIDTYY